MGQIRSFGTQDLELHSGAQVPSNGWQAQGLVIIRHGFVEKPSTPLGALLRAAFTFPLHTFMFPQEPFPFPFIDNTAQC